MPFTPIHFVPGLIIYFLFFPYLDLLAFSLSLVFIDIEPFMNLFVLNSYPLHGFFHSLLGSLIVAAPALILVCRRLEKNNHAFSKLFKAVGWSPEIRSVPMRTTTLSVYLGLSTHLTLDYLMHSDVSVFYPFSPGNPFQSEALSIMSQTLLYIGVLALLLLWLIRKRIYKEKPFQHFP